MIWKSSSVFPTLLLGCISNSFALPPQEAEVRAAMQKAATYFRGEVAVNGGYVYFYSPDLQRRLGEGAATPTEIWVQPPGTPTVGIAYLRAWKATNDSLYLEAARETGEALVYGQLQSGGWRNSINFDPSGPRVDRYRNGKGKGKNNSTLDDGISQAALRMLIQLDAALNFQAKTIHEAAEYGLKGLLNGQFSNGAFPQVWNAPVEKDLPTKTANYPEYDWRTEGRIKNYWDMYTLNDGLAGDVTDTLLEAIAVYDNPAYETALTKLGDFLIISQMPEPQPGWAQQYNREIQPIWARKFEPPAVAGRESQDVMESLLKIYQLSKDEKYLAPIITGVKYLEKSLLPDGRLSRYYELETNKPLYMERSGNTYSLTHDDSNLPNHYGWKAESRLESIKMRYRLVKSGKPLPTGLIEEDELLRKSVEIIKNLDDQGRWITTYEGERLIGQAKFKVGDPYISSEIFSENIKTLSRYLESL